MKKLVICCDGTWNRADQQSNGTACPTNVVKMAYRIAKRADANTPQIVYYHQGVGTGNALDRYTGGAFGDGLEANIYDAYRFLVANYEDGDEIYIFGFSRGAFTARSIVGMIRNCGILRRESVNQYRAAVAMYHDAQHGPDDPIALEFKKAHSVCGEREVPVKFIGVWDTVGALGIPLRGLRWMTRKDYQFHDTRLSKIVEHAYHALAIDERREPFQPTLWQYTPRDGQTVEQVWFAGVHSDVGGGYPETGLSDVALDWMIGKARAAGLAFDAKTLQTFGLRSNFAAQAHDSRSMMYKMTKPVDRAIGLSADNGGDPTQSVHPSVLERWDTDHAYRPAGLRAWLARRRDGRAECK
jgi:uncharacterized protein (DUF2235 family)